MTLATSLPKPFTFTALACLALLTACGSDKNLDDYHNERTTAELGRLQTVVGSYRGTAVTQRDGSSLGNLQIDLTTVVNTINNGDNTSTTGQVGLIGKITLLNGNQQSSAAIQTAQFLGTKDSNSGNFSGQAAIGLRDGSTAHLTINGTITGDTFTGLIAPSDRSGSAATFKLVKDAPFPGQRATQPRTGPNGVLAYQGSFRANSSACNGPGRSSNLCRGREGGGNVSVRLVLNTLAPTPEETFANNFLDGQTVTVQLSFGDIPVSFTSARLEQKLGTLVAQGTASGNNANLTLECFRQGGGLHCTFQSSYLGVTNVFDVAPTAPKVQ